MDEHFDYWGRCADHNYELERRVAYCKSILADGRHRQLAVLAEIGDAYFDARKYVDAATTYTEALAHEDSLYQDKLDDYRGWANSRLEEALLLSGQFDAAIDHVNTRIRNNPDAAMLYNQRCWLRAIAGRELDSALADCNEALKREPDSAAALDSRGLANFKLGKLNEADADYQAVLKKNEKKPSSLYVRGILRLRSGDAERGKEDLAAAEKIDPMIAARFADYGVKP